MRVPANLKALKNRLLLISLGVGLGLGARVLFDTESQPEPTFSPLDSEVVERTEEFDFFQQLREDNPGLLELPE